MRQKRRGHNIPVSKKDTDRLRQMLAQVLDYAAPSLKVLAKQAGISWYAIRQYRRGQRTPTAAVIRRLAGVLRARGGKLKTLAAQLERLGGER